MPGQRKCGCKSNNAPGFRRSIRVTHDGTRTQVAPHTKKELQTPQFVVHNSIIGAQRVISPTAHERLHVTHTTG